MVTLVESNEVGFPEQASSTPPQESSQGANKTETEKVESGKQDIFLDKHAKLISKEFWEAVENRCSDTKNNRNLDLMKKIN